MEENHIKIIGSLMKQIKTKLEKNLRANFSDHNLTFSQLSVLGLLHQNGEMRISDLNKKMGLTKSTTSGIVDRLEKMGLVRRIRNEQDRRVVKVELTDKVNELTRDFEAALEDSFSAFFKNASEDDINDIIKGLDKFNRVLGSTNPD